jgi:hypothetical protein
MGDGMLHIFLQPLTGALQEADPAVRLLIFPEEGSRPVRRAVIRNHQLIPLLQLGQY